MTTTLVWHEGGFLPTDTVAVGDHGLLLGDGVFDTLAVRDGHPLHLERHLRRLRAATARLNIAPLPDDADIAEAIAALVADQDLPRARVRITITPGSGPSVRTRGTRPTALVSIAELAEAPTAVSLASVAWVRNERSPLAGLKSTSWSENAQILREVRAGGFDEAVLCDTKGRLSECCAANLFLVIDEVVVTPSLATGCLPGIIREVLLERGAAVEATLTGEDLRRCEAAFITSSTNGVVGVERLDDRRLDPVAPAIDRARTALDAED